MRLNYHYHHARSLLYLFSFHGAKTDQNGYFCCYLIWTENKNNKIEPGVFNLLFVLLSNTVSVT